MPDHVAQPEHLSVQATCRHDGLASVDMLVWVVCIGNIFHVCAQICMVRPAARADPACLAQLAEAILHPERLAEVGALSEQQIRELWPPEVAQRTFVEYLRSQYDHTQLGAIEVGEGSFCYFMAVPSL